MIRFRRRDSVRATSAPVIAFGDKRAGERHWAYHSLLYTYADDSKRFSFTY